MAHEQHVTESGDELATSNGSPASAGSTRISTPSGSHACSAV